MAGEFIIGVGHLGWSRDRPGLDLYDGNDPGSRRPRPRFLDEPNVRDREGATVLVVVLSGRFSDNEYVGRVARRMVEAVRSEEESA